MNNLDKQYTDLLQDILDNGVTKSDRTGTGTLSVFGRQIRHKMSEGFPLLTTKKMYFKGIVTELLWFLRGDTNIKYLVDNDCHIWDGDTIKNWMSSAKCYRFRRNLYIEPKFEILSVDEVSIQDFPYVNSDGYYGFEKDGIEELWVDFSKFDENNHVLRKFISDSFIYKIKTDDEFAKKWGELGPVYGKQWRNWNTNAISRRSTGTINEDGVVENMKFLEDSPVSIDQIQNLINDLKTNPDSRRLMVNAWNVGELDQMVLPPCHYGFQVYTRELSLEERAKWLQDNKGYDLLVGNLEHDHIREVVENESPTRAISLMWNQRSVDTFLGLPFNIASYGLLLEIIAKEVNMVPDELIGNLGDTHLYLNHVEQAKEQIGRELSLEERVGLSNNNDVAISNKMGDYSFAETQLDNLGIPKRTREPYPLPTLKHMKTDEFYKALSEDISLFTHLDPTDFQVENYQVHPHIKAPLSN